MSGICGCSIGIPVRRAVGVADLGDREGQSGTRRLPYGNRCPALVHRLERPVRVRGITQGSREAVRAQGGGVVEALPCCGGSAPNAGMTNNASKRIQL